VGIDLHTSRATSHEMGTIKILTFMASCPGLSPWVGASLMSSWSPSPLGLFGNHTQSLDPPGMAEVQILPMSFHAPTVYPTYLRRRKLPAVKGPRKKRPSEREQSAPSPPESAVFAKLVPLLSLERVVEAVRVPGRLRVVLWCYPPGKVVPDAVGERRVRGAILHLRARR